MAAIIISVIPFSLSAQDTHFPTDVGAFVDQAAQFVARTLAEVTTGASRVAVTPFTANNVVSSLGELLALSISTRIANEDSPWISVVDRPGAEDRVRVDYIVTGRFFTTESALLVVVQIISYDDREIIRGMESGFGLSDWVTELYHATPVILVESGFGTDPYEPDSRTEPLELRGGETVDGRDISPEADEDWYVFNVGDIDGNGLLTVGTIGETDTYMEAYGPDDPNVLAAENDDADDYNAEITFAVEAGQRYWFMVTGYDESTVGDYSLFANLVPFDGDPLEPNDNAEDAVLLSVSGDTVESMIIPGSDVDWFAFDLDTLSGSENVVSIETAGGLDTYIELYDSAERLLMENDDGGEGENGRIDAFLSDAGRYYVRVRHYDGSNQGDFTVGVRLLRASPDQFEPDNTRGEARSVPTDGSRETRNFTPSDETDWITFTIQATQTVEIRTTGDIDTKLVLYDSLGNMIVEDDDSGSDYNARVERILQRGTYYVELSQVASDSVFGGEYGLSVHAF
jgi:hypothetical protein